MVNGKRITAPVGGPAQLAANSRILLNEFRETSLILRNGVLSRLFDPRRDLDKECGYPDTIDAQAYRAMYDREGVAARVNDVYPDECWAMDPYIYETEGTDTTPFEEAWDELNETQYIVPHMQRADLMSGIGHYGIMLLGLDDGADFAQPVPGIDDYGKPIEGAGATEQKLLYIRVFDESQVRIVKFNGDVTSPRYGQPEMYSIQVMDPRNESHGSGIGLEMRWLNIHWTRIIHVADRRLSSEVFGSPRMRPVWNRLCDLRKILGGSAEMFYKGGFPGYSFESHPELGDVDIDKTSLREEFNDYQNGLQRLLMLNGMTVKNLAPQVASPLDHYEVQLKAIAVTIGVPLRIFVGSEESKISSTQDSLTWNKRLAKRQAKYLTPMVVRPVIDRLIAFGILPKPAKLFVAWPDLNTSTDQEKAATAAQRTNALATYVGGGVEALIPPEQFMTHVLNMSPDVVQDILDAAAAHEPTLESPEEKAAKLGGANNDPKPAVKKAKKPAKAPPVKKKPK